MKHLETEISELFQDDPDVAEVLSEFAKARVSPQGLLDRLIFLRECARGTAWERHHENSPSGAEKDDGPWEAA